MQPQRDGAAQLPLCSPDARLRYWQNGLLLRHGSSHMRVKLCSRCPYTPRDLAGHYDPEAAVHVCAKCDRAERASTNCYPRKADRRQQCVTPPNITGIAQPSVAQFATESLALSGTTSGEPHFARGSALTASRHARKATVDGYVDFRPPDDCAEPLAAILSGWGFCNREPAE
jgi:hypothetical protein